MPVSEQLALGVGVVGSKAPVVVGKFVDGVIPETYAFPDLSMAIARPEAPSLPARNEEYNKCEPSELSFVTKASDSGAWFMQHVNLVWKAPAVTGKSFEYVAPVM